MLLGSGCQVLLTPVRTFIGKHQESLVANHINLSLCYLDSNIQTISLASGSDPSPGETVTASGWGRPSDSAGSISDVLREVDVPVMSNTECDGVYGIVNDGHICIDSKGGKGTCNVNIITLLKLSLIY